MRGREGDDDPFMKPAGLRLHRNDPIRRVEDNILLRQAA